MRGILLEAAHLSLRVPLVGLDKVREVPASRNHRGPIAFLQTTDRSRQNQNSTGPGGRRSGTLARSRGMPPENIAVTLELPLSSCCYRALTIGLSSCRIRAVIEPLSSRYRAVIERRSDMR